MTFGQKVYGEPMLQVLSDEWIDFSHTAKVNGEVLDVSDPTQFAKVLWQHVLQGEAQ